MQGFARVSVAVPTCTVADVEKNAQATLALWRRAADEESSLVVFPELGLSAYTVRDLFFDGHLLDGCERALGWLAAEGRALRPLAIVGLPLRFGGGL
jgi:NAD+ synthase (glutamine-hydrolysing)